MRELCNNVEEDVTGDDLMTTTTQHRRPTPRTPRREAKASSEVGGLRRRFGLSQAFLARLLDVSLRTVSALENRAVPEAQVRRNLIQLKRLCAALAEAMESN